MPRHTHLLRRGSQYYINVRVPKDLRTILKKDTVRKSLHTSDPREAVQRVRIESVRVHDEFEQLRAKPTENTERTDLSAISEGEAYNIAVRHFTELEKMSEHWWENEVPQLEEWQLDEALENLRIDEVVYTGGSKHYEAEDGRWFLDSFLRERRASDGDRRRPSATFRESTKGWEAVCGNANDVRDSCTHFARGFKRAETDSRNHHRRHREAVRIASPISEERCAAVSPV